MIDKFEVYIKAGKVKKKVKDSVEGLSLLEKAQIRIKYLRPLNKDTSSLILEDTYEAIREAAQALMSVRGFKPYSHEATISFLKEFYKNQFSDYEINKFDRFRELRNNSVYKAQKIDISEAVECMEFCNVFIKKIEKVIKNEV